MFCVNNVYVIIKKKERKDKCINRRVLLNSFTTSMYKKATNILHFKVGIMMETLYNFVKKKNPAGRLSIFL